jgi:chromosome segregation ATPase
MIANKRRSIVEILSDVESAKADLQAHLVAEESSVHDTAATLSAAGDTVTALASGLSLLSVHVSNMWINASAEQRARCHLEQLLWTRQQHVQELESLVYESNRSAQDALDGFAGLSDQMQQLWEEKMDLERQVMEECASWFFSNVCSIFVWRDLVFDLIVAGE